MGSDYSKAVWLPCKNFWPGGNSMSKVVVHGTASGGPQTGYQLATSSEFNDLQSASVTYINDVDGTVYQVVAESDSHWGNCCVYGSECPAGYYPLAGTGNCYLHGLIETGLPGAINHNHETIAIENVKHSSDNSEVLTTAQYASLVNLVADICTRRHILPVKGSIIGHFDLDPRDKARCPGPLSVPDLNDGWSRFYRDVQTHMGFGPMAAGEVHTLAMAAGFTEAQADVATAICHAESNLMRYRQGIVADGSLDRGLPQFNSHWHGEVTDQAAYDPAQAMKDMYRISKNGTDFSSWNTYKSGAYQQYMTILTPSGEVAVFPQSNQFENGETQSACGFYSNALAYAAAQPPNGTPKLDSEHVDQLADQYYVKYDGANTSSNENGMSIDAQEGMLNSLGVPFTHMAVDVNSAHSHDIALVKAWANLGYWVIVTIPETSVYDMDVGGNPYAWVVANPAAWAGVTHIVTVVGIDTRPGFAGHLMYRDTANYRSSPRTYSNDQIIFNRAIAINPSWLPRRADGFDPLVSTGGGNTVGVPTGWTDDGTLLHAPNGHVVRGGIRGYVKAKVPQWPGNNVPLEDEHNVAVFEYSNPTWYPGGGPQQTFWNSMIAWVGSAREEVMGPELMYFRKKAADLQAQAAATQSQLDAATAKLSALTQQEAADQTQITGLNAQIVALQAQIAAAGSGAISPEEQAAINNAVLSLQALQSFVK